MSRLIGRGFRWIQYLSLLKSLLMSIKAKKSSSCRMFLPGAVEKLKSFFIDYQSFQKMFQI